MGLLDDLDLGTTLASEEEDSLFPKGLFPRPLRQPPPVPPLPPMPGVAVDVDEPAYSPQEQQLFRDYKKFDEDLGSLSSESTALKSLSSHKKKAVHDFMEKTVDPFFMQTNPYGDSKITSKSESWDPVFKTLEDHFAYNQTKLGEKKFWGGDTESAKAAAASMALFPKYKQIREKYNRLKDDWSKAEGRSSRAYAKKMSLTEAKHSLPMNFRRAAGKWKEENPGKELSDRALNELLDAQNFEEPYIDEFSGRILNEDKLDPRKPIPQYIEEITGKDRSAPENARRLARLQKVREKGLKGLKSRLKEEKIDTGLSQRGWLTSNFGDFAGYPMGVNKEERAILNLDAMRQAGIKSHGGKPLEQAIAEMGGEDKIAAAKMSNVVATAWKNYLNAGVDFYSDHAYPNGPKKREKFQLTEKALEDAFQQAIKMGFGPGIAMKGETLPWWKNMWNAMKRGDLQEDLSDFTPALLGLSEMNEKSAASIIDIMSQIEELPTSSAYKKLQAYKSKDTMDAFKNLFRNWGALGEMAGETFVSFFSTYFTEAPRTLATTGGAGAAAGFAKGIWGGPKAGVAAATAWGFAGLAHGTKINLGVSSFVLEFVGEYLHQLD